MFHKTLAILMVCNKIAETILHWYLTDAFHQRLKQIAEYSLRLHLWVRYSQAWFVNRRPIIPLHQAHMCQEPAVRLRSHHRNELSLLQHRANLLRVIDKVINVVIAIDMIEKLTEQDFPLLARGGALPGLYPQPRLGRSALSVKETSQPRVHPGEYPELLSGRRVPDFPD